MYTTEQLITYLIGTLETIPVTGTDNMSKMIGCVEALKEIKKNLNKPDEPEEVGEEINAE